MFRLLFAILMGYLVFTIMGVQFLYGLVNDPMATFHSMPLWFWAFGIWIFAGSVYTAGRE